MEGSSITFCWKALGECLGLHDSTIKKIENASTNEENHLIECLSLWLKRWDFVDDKGGPTYSNLENAFKTLGEEIIAQRVANNFRPRGLFL